jgi:hypothetical protein
MTNYSPSMKIMLKFLQQLLATVTALVVLFYGTAIALSYGSSTQVEISQALIQTANQGSNSIFQVLRGVNLTALLENKETPKTDKTSKMKVLTADPVAVPPIHRNGN